jgi:uncharacterized protein (TIGR02246 family)
MKRILAAAVLAMLVAPVARAQAPSAAEQELIKLENAWSTAWQKKDVAALDRLFAAEYLSTDSDGKTTTKAQDLQDVKDPTTTLTSFKLENLTVHVYNDAFAVVTGSNTEKATFKGKDDSGTYMFTDVFVKRDGRWQIVATQSSKVK